MQVKSKDGSITALRGRFGDIVFRTFKSGKIFATYAPRQHRSIFGPSSVHLREQIEKLNMIIVDEPKKRKHYETRKKNPN